MRFIVLLTMLLMPIELFAQAAAPTDKFEFNMEAPSLAAANGYRYDVEMDTVVLPTPLVVTCTGAASPFTCRAPIPAITPSQHVARIRAVDAPVGGTVLIGSWSDLLTFSMRATPAKPGGVRINGGN